MHFSDLEMAELRQEGIPVLERLREVEDLNKKMLFEEEVSLESVRQVELLTEACFASLDYSLEVNQTTDLHERLSVNLESLLAVASTLKGLLDNDADDSDRIKYTGRFLRDLQKSVLDDKWLEKQEFLEENIEGGHWVVLFHHQGKLVKDPIRAVEKEIRTLSDITKKLLKYGPPYNEFVKEVFKKTVAGNKDIPKNIKQIHKNFQSETEDTPASPLDAFTEDEYELLGFAKGITFPPAKGKNNKKYFHVPRLSDEEIDSRQLSPLNAEKARKLADLAVKVSEVYAELRSKRPITFPDIKMKEKDQERLDKGGKKKWSEIEKFIKAYRIDRVSNEGFRVVEDHCIKLIYTIHQYLDSSIKGSIEQSSKKSGDQKS